jgi:hypothetical protein
MSSGELTEEAYIYSCIYITMAHYLSIIIYTDLRLELDNWIRTAKSKILSKNKFLVSSKTLLEIRYQVNFVLRSKRFYLKQVHM